MRDDSGFVVAFLVDKEGSTLFEATESTSHVSFVEDIWMVFGLSGNPNSPVVRLY